MSGQDPNKQSDYETIAQTVGVVPSLNAKDNLYQGIFVVVSTLFMALLGLAMGGGYNGAMIGALLGLIGSGFLSGLVLMVLGLVRAANRKK